ncbi:hypothetical protein AUR66_19915 [Haloferax profundi]|uniref:Capsule biosynthesis CapC n=1 Tax=Haloferax profundi TaxID=1544718 RepID=A0A0W1RF61_9EURY|nr:hypothetical protein AUR66_19915 [Haloferax profundi]
MLIATLLAVLGFIGVAIITQFRGYRLGGTITTGIVAVYTLKNFVMFPVFVLSTALAYLALKILKQRTLIYGRDELVAAILVGTLVPVTILGVFSEIAADVRSIAFVGSILPGLAAYNYHQMKPETRWHDMLATVGVFAALLGIGTALVSPAGAKTIGTLTPPVLYSETSEIAVYRGAVVEGDLEGSLIPRQTLVFVLMLGLIVAERLRARFDVRTGVIAAALLAVFALESRWLLVLYASVYVLSYGLITVIHYTTLRYGRVLLGVGSAFATVLTVGLTLLLPVSRGLAAFFTGVIAGVMAYNTHATAPEERSIVIPLQIAVFVPLLVGLRMFVSPGEAGFPQTLSIPVLVGAVLVTGVSLWYAHANTVQQPDNDSVLSASVLSDGDGA